MSQEQLANLVSRRQATISGWESGKRLPSLEDLYDLAYVLDRDVYDFLPRRRLEPPLRGLLRAMHEQLPMGARFRAALEIFIKSAAATETPQAIVEISSDDPESAAGTLLDACSVTRPPVDVVAVAKECGTRVAGWEAMDEAISGLLVQLDDGPLIVFNGKRPHGRQRFTVAHELGHFLLGHSREFHVDLSSPLGSEDRPGYHRRQEKAANTFAANLLMPEEWVREHSSKGTIESVAVRFQVSEIAMGYRLLGLGIQLAGGDASSPGPSPN